MKGSFSEESLRQFSDLVAQTQSADFSEGEVYDFTRCVRPDGSAYGTRGTCRKGTEGAAQEKQAISQLGSMLPKGEKIVDSKGGLHTAAGAASKPPAGGKGSRGPIDHEARVAKHQAAYEAAKTAHAASKAALAAHKGRDARSRALKQPLQSKHEANIEKLGAARDRLIDAKVKANAAKSKAPAGSDLKKKMTELGTRIKRQETAIARMSPGKYTRREIEIEKQTLEEMKARLKGLESGKAAGK